MHASTKMCGERSRFSSPLLFSFFPPQLSIPVFARSLVSNNAFRLIICVSFTARKYIQLQVLIAPVPLPSGILFSLSLFPRSSTNSSWHKPALGVDNNRKKPATIAVCSLFLSGVFSVRSTLTSPQHNNRKWVTIV